MVNSYFVLKKSVSFFKSVFYSAFCNKAVFVPGDVVTGYAAVHESTLELSFEDLAKIGSGDGYINGFPFNFGFNLVVCLAIGLVIGLITVLVLKGQLKTVRKQNLAHNYVIPGSMQITVQNDLYLYSDLKQTRKESKSSSSSGGSRSTGGGSF